MAETLASQLSDHLQHDHPAELAVTIETAAQPQRFRDREREIELEAALLRFWEFTRSAVPLDALTDEMQDECWALDALGKKVLKRR